MWYVCTDVVTLTFRVHNNNIFVHVTGLHETVLDNDPSILTYICAITCHANMGHGHGTKVKASA